MKGTLKQLQKHFVFHFPSPPGYLYYVLFNKNDLNIISEKICNRTCNNQCFLSVRRSFRKHCFLPKLNFPWENLFLLGKKSHVLPCNPISLQQHSNKKSDDNCGGVPHVTRPLSNTSDGSTPTHTWGPFHKGGSTNSEPNPELWVDLP